MKIVLSSLTAKYIHSALAIRYLYGCCKEHLEGADISLKEFTINNDPEDIVAELYREKPDVLGLSCYIWNIEHTLRVCLSLKKVLPQVIIVLGGPEVSYDAIDVLEKHPAVDYIIRGEGELPFVALLKGLMGQKATGIPALISCDAQYNVTDISGLVYRDAQQRVKENDVGQDTPMVELPFPYHHPVQQQNLEHKIIYYEASRGCPYRCAYCLSGIAGKVRSLPLARVKKDLLQLIGLSPRQIKFVDRTFNFDKSFAREVFTFLAQQETPTTFHFEICADLLDAPLLDFLRRLPPGKFQFEIGVQSTNPQTLQAIGRVQDFMALATAVKTISQGKNIHQHLDLIAGLPYEDMPSMQRSFDDVYELNPEMLQLGFLKLLKGSRLREMAETLGYVYRPYPPYEVLATPWLSYGEMLELKDMERVLNLFYNSQLFTTALAYLTASTPSAFKLYKHLGNHFVFYGYHLRQHTLIEKFEILYNFGQVALGSEHLIALRELLKLDMLRHFKHRRLPKWCEPYQPSDDRHQAHQLLTDEKVLARYLPHLAHYKYKDLIKMVHVEAFPVNMSILLKEHRVVSEVTKVVFDYSRQGAGFFENKARYHIIDNPF